LHLDPRSAYIIQLRYGLGGDNQHPHALDECAKIIGVSRERIRQIEMIALKKLSVLLRVELVEV
jgi:RNA polymerase primary sigma factor